VPTEELRMTIDGAGTDGGRPDERPVRPGVLQWLRYAMGGRLPQRYSSWVLHDTTTRTWWLRHIARALLQLAVPIALVVLFVPGPLWIRLMAALGGVLLGLFFSLAYMTETLENRVKQAGFPPGAAQAGRDRVTAQHELRDAERRRAAAARRAARYRQRQGR
jgi:hypothetical protein